MVSHSIIAVHVPPVDLSVKVPWVIRESVTWQMDERRTLIVAHMRLDMMFSEFELNYYGVN